LRATSGLLQHDESALGRRCTQERRVCISGDGPDASQDGMRRARAVHLRGGAERAAGRCRARWAVARGVRLAPGDSECDRRRAVRRGDHPAAGTQERCADRPYLSMIVAERDVNVLPDRGRAVKEVCPLAFAPPPHPPAFAR